MANKRTVLDRVLANLKARLNDRLPLHLHLVTDITDPNSNDEIVRGVEARLHEAGLPPLVAARRLDTGAFRVHEAAAQLAKSVLPLPSIDVPNTVTLVNVAEIDEATDGVRQDFVFVGAAGVNHDRLVIGFATMRSPILSIIYRRMGAFFRVNVGTRFSDMHFRSRDGLPEILAGLIAGNRWPCNDLLKIYRGRIGSVDIVGDYKPGLAWWYDYIGGVPFNIKTGFCENDPVVSRRFNDIFVITVTIDGQPMNFKARYVKSVQDALQGEVVLTKGSSGYTNQTGPVQFLDLFCKGAPLPQRLGINPFGRRGPMIIERANAR